MCNGLSLILTFKDLQRLIQEREQNHGSSNNSEFSFLKGRPFWYWGKGEHAAKAKIEGARYCCFNHAIGLPKKDGQEKPMFDYKRFIYEALLDPSNLNAVPKTLTSGINPVAYPFKLKHLWIKKATDLGVTEFILRFMAWLCLRIDDYQNSQMVIVTGPNQELAIKLI